MAYKYETKNCEHCKYRVKTDKGLYCSNREGHPKITNGGWCIDRLEAGGRRIMKLYKCDRCGVEIDICNACAIENFGDKYDFCDACSDEWDTIMLTVKDAFLKQREIRICDNKNGGAE